MRHTPLTVAATTAKVDAAASAATSVIAGTSFDPGRRIPPGTLALARLMSSPLTRRRESVVSQSVTAITHHSEGTAMSTPIMDRMDPVSRMYAQAQAEVATAARITFSTTTATHNGRPIEYSSALRGIVLGCFIVPASSEDRVLS